MTDPLLIQNCQKNDRAAQKQLFEQSYGSLMALCMRYAKNSAQAKEMLSNGFTRICADIQDYKKEQDFDKWMRRKMAELAVAYLRERRQEYYITTTVRISGEEKKAELDLFNQQVDLDESSLSTEDYLRGLQVLPPSFRAVYNMCVIDEFTDEEAAKALDISTDTCRYNLSKAKAAFFKNLQEIQTEA
jgi:RNA polymerase sigma factor (sigma-70 family)